MSNPTIDLDAIERRCKAATEGPWEFDARNAGNVFECCYGLLAANGCTLGVHVEGGSGKDDDAAQALADFIAHARTDLPALVALAREQRRRTAELDDRIKQLEAALMHAEGCYENQDGDMTLAFRVLRKHFRFDIKQEPDRE